VNKSLFEAQKIAISITTSKTMYIWLVVSTPLKNISQLGSLFTIYGKIKNYPNHQPDTNVYNISVKWPGFAIAL
jgi:hypothetical protein